MVEPILISSAKKYYDYLLNHHKGVESIAHLGFEFRSPDLIIALKYKIFTFENLFLEIEGREYWIGEDEEIELLSYDEHALSLTLRFKTPDIFKNSFVLKSDLKFLVKNVEHFFSKQRLIFPQKKPISPPLQMRSMDLNAEQKRAVETIFAHPLVYVWGPPGSGKTQRVLFEAIEKLICLNKKVALIAPTNHALEQAIKALIKQFDALNFPREHILRLGIPTLEFSTHYPEVCEKSKENNLFFATPLKQRIQSAHVLAMTLDGFIGRYESLGVSFDHVFLDECAFAPLSKVCALCACDAPLTLLGDHKQLKPVCELGEREKRADQELALWGISGLYLEHFFNNTFNQSNFSHTQCVLLKQTHRYGDNLASILNAYVYKNGLRGKAEQSQLYYLDVSELSTQFLKANEDNHVNLQEVAGVRAIYHHEWAIITPFLNQRKALISNGLPYDRVFTIHGSQGQEFDGVIFSPVHLSYHLTDSRQKSALYALNVAISRMRKKLVIVCDYAYWMKQEGQFIRALLLACKPYAKR